MTTYRPGSVLGSRRAGWLAWAGLVALLAGCQTAGGAHRDSRGWSAGVEPGLAAQDGGGATQDDGAAGQDGSATGQEGVDPAAEDDFGEFDDEFADFDEFEDFEDLGEEETEPVYDPLEGVNRAIHGFNDGFYVHVWDPLASGYAWALPQGVRVAVNRFFRNLFTPARAVNSLLQWKLDKADVEVRRFLVNTTLGIGGLFEPAEAWFDLKAPSPEDFGQTLATWGVGPGPPIVIPFFGPSNVRDGLSGIPDSFLNPILYFTEGYEALAITAWDELNGTSLRLGQYESLKADALDPYTLFRDVYRENRESRIQE